MLTAKELKKLDKDDVLGLLGLETKRTTADWLAPTLTAFSVGVAVGVGLGMLLAPRASAGLFGAGAGSRMPGERDDMSAPGGMGAERVGGTR